MRLKNTATIKREPLFKQENPLELVSSDCCRCCWSAWCMHELFKEKGYYKSKYTHSRAHTPLTHTHTRSARVCIYEHIFFMCISLDFVVVRRMETRLSNWKFLLPPRLLQFRAIPLQFPLLLYSLLFLSSSHSPAPSCCCCSC